MTDTRESYVSQFREAERDLARGGDWLIRLRRSAIEQFRELGFPTPRLEEWKYTNVAPIASVPFRIWAPGRSSSWIKSQLSRTLGDDLRNVMVFENGRYRPALSRLDELPDGARATSFAEALRDHPKLLEPHFARYAAYQSHAFVALNTAFAEDGAFIEIPSGATVHAPIYLAFFSDADKPSLSNPRVMILAGEHSSAKVVEAYFGQGQYLTNAVSEIVVGPSADLEHYKLQQDGDQASHIALTQVDQRRNSRFTSHALAVGARLARNELRISLDAEGSQCALNGLYLAAGRQHLDNTTFIDHLKPRCTSRELYKGIVGDNASAIFSGRVLVRPDAQKTDASQTNKNLLLSQEATVDSKPQLAIYADDVKCTHGATVGQLDEEALFYLRSRGIGLEQAKAVLTYAFASEMVGRVDEPTIRGQFQKLVSSKLPVSLLLEEGR
jgi:Fe-S cluster assembly protein SufD